jgi:hypothetical protein
MAKKDIKKEVQEDKINAEDIHNKQLKWIIAIIIIVFVVFLGTYYGVKTYQYNAVRFDYLGAHWVIGGTETNPSYRASFKFGNNENFGLYMRNDPRKNNVSIGENITFKFYPNILTSYDKDLESCKEAVLNQINLVYFFSGVNVKLTPAMFNRTQAEERNVTFATCNSAVSKTVIILRKSEMPSVEQDERNKDCYIINVGNCENSLAVEKFMLAIMKQLQQEKNTN